MSKLGVKRISAKWITSALVLVLGSCLAGRSLAQSPAYPEKWDTSARDAWAFQKPREQSIPQTRDSSWPRTPIDRFVLSELEKRDLKPAPPADKATLLRRATFDLTGLPPKPEEIAAFLKNPAPDAFASVVDRLLDSPQYGERWGRHWLDVARYADSNGLEPNIAFENAWRYRDYVIESYNEDKPFDEFIREQIAGDILPAENNEERIRQLIASGFLVIGPKPFQEPNRAKLVMDVADEQIDATTKAFLGLTVSCARCHDHKFDPIPTRDYYALAGIFKSTATLSAAAGPGTGPEAPRWMERPIGDPAKAKEIEAYNTKLNKLMADLTTAREVPGGIESKKLPGVVVDNSAAEFTGQWKSSLGYGNFVDKDYVHDGATRTKGAHSARFVPKLPHTGKYEVVISYTPAANRATNVPVTIRSSEGEKTIILNQRARPHFKKAFASIGTYEFTAGTNDSVVISNRGTQGFVVADAVAFIPVDEYKLELASEMEEARMLAASSKMVPDQALPGAGMSMAGPAYDQLQNAIFDLRSQAPPPMEMAMAVQEGEVANCRVNLRGDPDRLGEEVPRGFLRVLQDEPARISAEGSGRIELANWIASPDNPLTARVAANRIWLHLFGRGLVGTPDNFGKLSEQPTHPALLDFLARQFVSDGWSTKKLIRSIMLSSAYQMSSRHDPEAYAKDPDNHFLWRMNRRRLEAEAIRDAILAVTGQLDPSAGGSMLSSNAIPMGAIRGVVAAQFNSNRRSVYLPVIRNNVPDLFQVFDFVDPHSVSGRRHVTTAPHQALFMMNSPFVQEQSAAWARNLLAGAPDDSARIRLSYQQAFGRVCDESEVQAAAQFLDQFAEHVTESDPAKKRALAWQSLCQTLLASTEFRFID